MIIIAIYYVIMIIL